MDESCDLIYTSHAFEYFDRFQAVDVLREWHRVLRNGGELLIAVPDFPKLIMVYQRTNDLGSIIGPLFGRWQVGNEEFIYHRTVWDFATLSGALIQAGFGEVEEYNPIDFLDSIDGDFDDHSLAFYPHFERTGIQISLCLRATKT